MSRLGKKPIDVPAGVNVAFSGRNVAISKGDKSLEIRLRPEVEVHHDEDAKSLTVGPAKGLEKDRHARAYWGLTRSLLANMIVGVTEGYRKQLEVVGVGYNANVAGTKLDLKLGFANTISVAIPPGVDVAVERQIITVTGPDKQKVGQFAAVVRSQRKPEPYNGKGVRYLGENIRRKQGKAFGA